MKTIDQVTEWRYAVAERFGDPAARTGHLFARLVPRPPDVPNYDDVIAFYEDDTLLISIERGAFGPVDVSTDGPQFDEETGAITALGLVKISDGLWALEPSLNLPGVIHAFVTIYDVPAVAPWENKIIVVSSMRAAGLK